MSPVLLRAPGDPSRDHQAAPLGDQAGASAEELAVTLWDFANVHPAWTLALLFCSGYPVAHIVTAVARPFAQRRRPGDCPRCNGSGREPKP